MNTDIKLEKWKIAQKKETFLEKLSQYGNVQ
jgi:hypothetical protein